MMKSIQFSPKLFFVFLVGLVSLGLVAGRLFQVGQLVVDCYGVFSLEAMVDELGQSFTRLTGDCAVAQVSPTPTVQVTPGRGTATFTVTPSPTFQLTSSPRATVTPPGSVTSTPTVVVTILPTVPPGGQVPLCTFHDPSVWHALAAYDANGAVVCHYDHEHKHDPGEVNDVFGVAGAWFGRVGQSISYAWETLAENLHKHPVYSWVVRKGIPRLDNDAVWITDFRVQGHVDTAPFKIGETWSGGYLGRQHSAAVEARGCSESGCGLIAFGGWLNYGLLEIDEGNCVYLPSDDLSEVCGSAAGGRRIHFDAAGFPPTIPNRATFFWYGEPSCYPGPNCAAPSVEVLNPVVIAFATSDSITEVSLATLFAPDLATFCPDGSCFLNGSTIQQHVLQFNVPGSLDPDGDGFADFSGFTDQFMRVIQGCVSAGPHPTLGQTMNVLCVPLVLEHMPVGLYEHRDDTHFGYGPGGAVDFDTSPAGEHWITWFVDP